MIITSMIIKSQYFFGSENLIYSLFFSFFVNVRSVTSSLVKLKWKKLRQWN